MKVFDFIFEKIIPANAVGWDYEAAEADDAFAADAATSNAAVEFDFVD